MSFWSVRVSVCNLFKASLVGQLPYWQIVLCFFLFGIGHRFFHDSGEDGDRRIQLTTSEDQKPVVFQAVNVEHSRVKPSDVSRRVIHDPKQQHKQYRCRHCRKEFSDRSMYLVHETRHTGKTCFHCEFCMKPFANRSELKIHERYHTGEKPFECRYCHKRFETSGNCQKHQRCHTGEKPYACGICGKGFSDVSNLRKHERTHQQKWTLTESVIYCYHSSIVREQNASDFAPRRWIIECLLIQMSIWLCNVILDSKSKTIVLPQS